MVRLMGELFISLRHLAKSQHLKQWRRIVMMQ